MPTILASNNKIPVKSAKKLKKQKSFDSDGDEKNVF